eukprot:2650273-Rhodomonas_salina.1
MTKTVAKPDLNASCFRGTEPGTESVDFNKMNQIFLDMGMKFDKFELRKMFQKFDEDGSGTIDFDEFCAMFSALNKYSSLVSPLSPSLFSQPYAPFLSLFPWLCALTLRMHNRKRFAVVFNDFDVDGSGQLDHDEVAGAFKTLGYEFSHQQVGEMIMAYDFSGDGSIELDERDASEEEEAA